MSIEYSECVSVAQVIQHAKRMCRIKLHLSSVDHLAAQYFSSHLIKGTVFTRKFIKYLMCILILPTINKLNISHYKKNSG